MKYDANKRIGDLGELIVAAAFIRHFRWPCRLQNMDVGIDAEVETTNNQGVASGKVIKVQVKATMRSFKNGINTIYPTVKHVNYWKEFSVPVLLCAVSLSSNEILWKLINPDFNYFTNKGARVDFDRGSDALNVNSRLAIEKIAVEGFDPVIQMLNSVKHSINSFFDASGNCTISTNDVEAYERHQLNREMINIAYRMIALSNRSNAQTLTNVTAALDRRWNMIGVELDRQAN